MCIRDRRDTPAAPLLPRRWEGQERDRREPLAPARLSLKSPDQWDLASRRRGQRASLGWGPPVLAGTRPPYPTALVDRVAEPKSVAALVFCQTVIAFRPGIPPS